MPALPRFLSHALPTAWQALRHNWPAKVVLIVLGVLSFELAYFSWRDHSLAGYSAGIIPFSVTLLASLVVLRGQDMNRQWISHFLLILSLATFLSGWAFLPAERAFNKEYDQKFEFGDTGFIEIPDGDILRGRRLSYAANIWMIAAIESFVAVCFRRSKWSVGVLAALFVFALASCCLATVAMLEEGFRTS